MNIFKSLANVTQQKKQKEKIAKRVYQGMEFFVAIGF